VTERVQVLIHKIFRSYIHDVGNPSHQPTPSSLIKHRGPNKATQNKRNKLLQ